MVDHWAFSPIGERADDDTLILQVSLGLGSLMPTPTWLGATTGQRAWPGRSTSSSAPTPSPTSTRARRARRRPCSTASPTPATALAGAVVRHRRGPVEARPGRTLASRRRLPAASHRQPLRRLGRPDRQPAGVDGGAERVRRTAPGWSHVPLPAAVTPSTTYWIVAQAVGDASDTSPGGRPTRCSGAMTSPNGTTWTAQTYGYYFAVFDQSARRRPHVHRGKTPGPGGPSWLTTADGQVSNYARVHSRPGADSATQCRPARSVLLGRHVDGGGVGGVDAGTAADGADGREAGRQAHATTAQTGITSLRCS